MDYFKGISSFEFLDAYQQIDKAYVEQVLKEHFDDENMAISIVMPNK